MKQIILVTGGCRSGKSRHALQLAKQAETNNKIFIATCVPHDEEMRQRVVRHQAERSADWKTIEEPVSIVEIIIQNQAGNNVILVDCLTLWISNLLMASDDLAKLEATIDVLTDALARATGTVILVSNEVGSGIVPENRLARLFRDAAGLANQRVAACADQVIWMVAGIPVTVKSGKDQGIRTED